MRPLTLSKCVTNKALFPEIKHFRALINLKIVPSTSKHLFNVEKGFNAARSIKNRNETFTISGVVHTLLQFLFGETRDIERTLVRDSGRGKAHGERNKRARIGKGNKESCNDREGCNEGKR